MVAVASPVEAVAVPLNLARRAASTARMFLVEGVAAAFFWIGRDTTFSLLTGVAATKDAATRRAAEMAILTMVGKQKGLERK